MLKRIITLVAISSLISASLLFIGTTVMGKFSPALASGQDALVAGTDVQTSLVSNPVGNTTAQKNELGSENIKPELPVSNSASLNQPSTEPISTISGAVSNEVNSAPPVVSSQPSNATTAMNLGITPITGVTIAQLLENPEQYIHQVFTITGTATNLNHEKFLFNDGTGQILVEVDDDLVNFNIIDGQTITVTGQFDDSSNQIVYELDAYTLTDENGTVIIVDDCYDDCNDDLNDDCNDDVNDDINDDLNDDIDNNVDDDLDDDSDDDLDDDSDDDED
jgi:hypothetical protein